MKLPVITQPTRITLNTATLIDNFFTNRISKIIDSAIIVEDISDHLPIMTWIEITPKLNVNPRVTKGGGCLPLPLRFYA